MVTRCLRYARLRWRLMISRAPMCHTGRAQHVGGRCQILWRSARILESIVVWMTLLKTR